MVYLVKFLYGLVIPPGIFVLALIILSVYFYNRNKKAFIPIFVLTILFYLCNIPIVSYAFMRGVESMYIPPKTIPNADVIISLGAGATKDTPNIGGKGNVYGNSSSRIMLSSILYRKIKKPIIVSGGKVFKSSGSEGDIGKRTLIELGVPKGKIFSENRSLNTTQNAKYSVEIMKKNGLKKAILVTSAFHMARAVKQFKKYGIDVIPYPTDYQVNIHYEFSIEDFYPDGDSMSRLSCALKEYIGILMSKAY